MSTAATAGNPYNSSSSGNNNSSSVDQQQQKSDNSITANNRIRSSSSSGHSSASASPTKKQLLVPGATGPSSTAAPSASGLKSMVKLESDHNNHTSDNLESQSSASLNSNQLITGGHHPRHHSTSSLPSGHHLTTTGHNNPNLVAGVTQNNNRIIIEMKLEERTVANFKTAKLFRENQDRINSIDFSSNGETLITSSDDDSIVIYDCEKGTVKRSLNSKKYGVDLIHYTHAANTAIHSSNKVDDTIRYLSLHDNKYIRYFPGHTKKVVTLCMSPVDDTFLSGSLDKTIRLWDLRSPNCQGLMHLLGRPVANFDPEGLIFAVGINSESVKLYDLRSFDKGPFNTFKIPQDTTCDWTGLKFSPDGKVIMIYTNGNIIHTLDGFQGMPLQTLTGHVNNKGINLEASFSPDSQFIFSGSTDGRIYVWNSMTGARVAILQGDHSGPVQSVQFSPKYMMLASACSNMAFWVPTLPTNDNE